MGCSSDPPERLLVVVTSTGNPIEIHGPAPLLMRAIVAATAGVETSSDRDTTPGIVTSVQAHSVRP